MGVIFIQPEIPFLGVIFDEDHDFEGPRAPRAHLDTVLTKNLSHHLRRLPLMFNCRTRYFTHLSSHIKYAKMHNHKETSPAQHPTHTPRQTAATPGFRERESESSARFFFLLFSPHFKLIKVFTSTWTSPRRSTESTV